MPWCHSGYSAEEARIWVERKVQAIPTRTEFDFVIASPRGRFLGGCGLASIDRANLRAEVGYWVRSSEAGQRIASDALRLLTLWTFENTDLVRLEIVTATGNLVSHRVAEHAGALREGVLRSRLILNGTSHDATMFSIVRGRSTSA